MGDAAWSRGSALLISSLLPLFLCLDKYQARRSMWNPNPPKSRQQMNPSSLF